MRKPVPAQPEIILVTTSATASIVKDAGALIAAVLMIGSGRLLGVPALSWVGALLFVGGLVGVAMVRERRSYMTPADAAAYLKRKYKVVAK